MEAKKDKDSEVLYSSEAVRQYRVRQLWRARSAAERTSETGVLNFHKFLEEHFPNLLPPGQGDSYQRLTVELIQENEATDANPTAEPESK